MLAMIQSLSKTAVSVKTVNHIVQFIIAHIIIIMVLCTYVTQLVNQCVSTFRTNAIQEDPA